MRQEYREEKTLCVEQKGKESDDEGRETYTYTQRGREKIQSRKDRENESWSRKAVCSFNKKKKKKKQLCSTVVSKKG